MPWLQTHTSDFDLIVVNGVWQYTSFAVWRALHGTGKPYVVFTHGMLDPWFKRPVSAEAREEWLCWPWAEYRVLRDASAVLFTSEEEKRLARRSFWLCPLQRARHQLRHRGGACRRWRIGGSVSTRFPSVGNKRIILFLGRIHEKKGCELLIRAYASLLRDAPGARDGGISSLSARTRGTRIAARSSG